MTPSLDTLGRSLDQWQGLYILSITVAVLATIAIVYFAFHRDHKLLLRISNYAYVFASIFAVVSTIVIVNKTKSLDTEKDRLAGIEIATAKSGAATAEKDAEIARTKAEEARQNAEVARQKAETIQAKAEEARKNSLKAEAEAQSAVLDKEKILHDNLQLQQQLEGEKMSRLQIEKQLAPRDLNGAVQQQMIAQLRLLPTQTIDFVVYQGNPESDTVYRQIAWVFDQIHWHWNFISPMSGSLKGIRVEYDGDNKDATAVAKVIVTSLRSAGLETQTSSTLPPLMQEFGAYTSNGNVGLGKIRIFVGSK